MLKRISAAITGLGQSGRSRVRFAVLALAAVLGKPRRLLCYMVISSVLSGVAYADPPNVIVILTDDQGFGDIGRGGELDCNQPSADPANCQHPLETALRAAGLPGFTPNIDQLASEGVRFSDFHVTPVCATTRASLLTGRFNHRTGVLWPGTDRQILSPDETTLAELFRNAGYRTGMFGKWNLGDNFPSRPQDRGFDVVRKSGGPAHGMTADFWRNDCFGDTYFDEHGNPVSYGPDNVPPLPGDAYCTDIFFDEAEAFIASHVAQTPGQPFFAYIAPTAPHDLIGTAPRPFLPPNDPDPSVVYDSLGVDPVLADFYGAINGIDRNLGELRAFLQSMDLEDNTILVFFGDNGSQLTIADTGDIVGQLNRFQILSTQYGIPGTVFPPQPHSGYTDFINPAGLREYKFSLYEGGHRVFMFIRWPDGGISSQNVQEIDALTHVSDLFPTLLGQAGIPIDPGLQTSLDGISLELLLSGSPDDQFSQRTIFHQTEANRQDPVTGAYTPLPFANFGVLTSAWRLVHPWPAIAGGRRLYAASDRFQSTDVAATNMDVVADLEARYGDYYDSWVALYDDPGDRGRASIGAAGVSTQTLTSTSWLWTNRREGDTQDHISTGEPMSPAQGFWALDVTRSGHYSIKLRRWPSSDLAPAAIANQAIDPRGGESARVRLVISPEFFDVSDLALSGSGGNYIDLTNPIDASDAESEFLVHLEAGEVFLGGELTGVREVDCDVVGDPESCLGVLRSPYYANISFVTDTDNDGVPDSTDNCVLDSNASQQDTDGDLFGNACDCDFDQGMSCNIRDYWFFLIDFWDATDSGVGTDMDGSGTVGIADFNLFLPGFVAGEPGPSGLVP